MATALQALERIIDYNIQRKRSDVQESLSFMQFAIQKRQADIATYKTQMETLKSTNDIAYKLIKKNNIKPSIIISEKQTKGRGTMGKKWISKKGNLFLTIFFDMNKKKVDFKKFAVLNAYLLKNILAK